MLRVSDERLREIEEREQKATAGPWEAYTGFCQQCQGWHLEGPHEVGSTGILVQLRDGADQIEDLQFIAHSRQDIPDLVADLREARDELEWRRYWEWLDNTNTANLLAKYFGGYDNWPLGADCDNATWAIFDYERRVEKGEEE